MSSNAKRRQTMAKMARERTVKERRARKQEKRDAKKEASRDAVGEPTTDERAGAARGGPAQPLGRYGVLLRALGLSRAEAEDVGEAELVERAVAAGLSRPTAERILSAEDGVGEARDR